jgi:class 3 adenylate cyclase
MAEPGAVVFSDLVGFTEFTARAGDHEALRVLAVQDRIVADVLPTGSRVVKELGDGLMLWFADPCVAVSTMLAVRDGFDAAGASGEMPLWVRIGAHWGTPTRRGDDLVGHDANVAARIVDVASPGELLVSDALRVSGDHASLSFQEIGPVMMKGLVDPICLYRVERAADRGAAGSRAASA